MKIGSSGHGQGSERRWTMPSAPK